MTDTIRFGPGAGIFAAILLFAVAFAFGLAGLTLYRDVQTIRQWPSTEGVILSGEVTQHRVRQFTARGRPRTDGYRYSSRIAYSYTVDGEEYVSTQISIAKKFDQFADTFSGTADAGYEGTWLAKYPVGKKVAVYYDLDDPANAILERDEAWLAYLFFAVAGVLAFAGLGILNAVRHMRNESRFA